MINLERVDRPLPRRPGWASPLAAAALALAVLVCDHRSVPPSPLQNDPPLAALERAAGAGFVDGNAVAAVEDGAVFDAMERDLRAARRSVHILLFIWRGEGDPSERIARAVVERRPGTICRIVIDWWGSLKFSSATERRLTQSGCDVRRYGPPHDTLAIGNHRKIVVVDGRVAITGGFGIWRSWLGRGRKPEEWRDSNVRVRGPVVAQLQRAFAQSYREAGGAKLSPADPAIYPELKPEGTYRALFVASSPRKGLTAAEVMTHALIEAARRRLWIANSYFIPDKAIQELLVRKSREGVDVRVLAPGPVHDIALVRAAQRETYAPLLDGGVRIWEYQPSMMHAKTMIIDDALVAVGSTNIDALSFARLEEGSLVAVAPPLATEMARRFQTDLSLSKEITRELWKDRDFVPNLGREAAGLINDWL
jgi:cardiolipin synthase